MGRGELLDLKFDQPSSCLVQISLSDSLNKPCNLIRFKDTWCMFDTGLDATSTQTFLPLPLTHSHHFSSLPTYNHNSESQLESVCIHQMCASLVSLDFLCINLVQPSMFAFYFLGIERMQWKSFYRQSA